MFSSSSQQLAPSCGPASALVNQDLCFRCGVGGDLLCCDGCPRSVHVSCLPGLKHIPEGSWKCATCAKESTTSSHASERPQLTLLDKAVFAHGGGSPLGRLMQHLELVLPRGVFLSACDEVLDLSRHVQPARKRIRACSSESLLLHLRLAQVVGKDVLLDAVRAVEAGGFAAQGLGIMGGRGSQFCAHCGQFRVTRQVCLGCAALAMDDQGNDLGWLPNEEDMQVAGKVELPSALAIEQATERGIEYFAQCLAEEKNFDMYGGDMLFLAQKLVGALHGFPALRARAVEVCQQAAARFRHTRVHLDADVLEESNHVMDTVEGLHAIALLPDAPLSLPPAPPQQSPAPPQHPQMRSARASALAKLKVHGANDVFDHARMSAEVLEAMHGYDLTELLGFNPLQDGVPQTPQRHCSNCAKINKPKSALCSECGCLLKCKIDYGALTDACVWSFVFGTFGLPLECQRLSRVTELKFAHLCRFLPEARSYRDLAELGHDFWKLQSYFASHFVYIMSGWGANDLRREFYVEEFRYFAENLRRVVKMQDPELVGEFLHCLRLLGFDPAARPCPEHPSLVKAYREAVAYLVRAEDKGMWTSSVSTPYARYHSAWCGVVGLIPVSNAREPPVAFVGSFGLVHPQFALKPRPGGT
jgi:hypothetical protein